MTSDVAAMRVGDGLRALASQWATQVRLSPYLSLIQATEKEVGHKSMSLSYLNRNLDAMPYLTCALLPSSLAQLARADALTALPLPLH